MENEKTIGFHYDKKIKLFGKIRRGNEEDKIIRKNPTWKRS